MLIKADHPSGGSDHPLPKVLWVTKGLNRGGAEVLLLALAQEENLRGFELHIATVMGSHTQMAAEFEELGICVHNLGAKSTLDLRWISRLRKLIRCGDFAIVHSHSPLPASVARILTRLRPGGPRSITTEHAMRDLYSWPTRRLNDFTARLDHLRVVVSQAAAESFRDRSEMKVVYHGVRLHSDSVTASAVDGMREECGVTSDDCVILTIANLRPEKNVALLVKAFSRLPRAIDSVSLVVVGDGPCMQSVSDAAASAGIADRVRLLGRRDDAWRYLAIADIFALSSDKEGLPVSIMEAMTMGRPVVATRVGGVPELVVDRVSGYLVEPGDDVAMAEALTTLIIDSRRRRAMGQAARSASAKCSCPGAAASYAALYRELLT